MTGHSVDMCSLACVAACLDPARPAVLARTFQTAHTTSTNNFVVRTYFVFTAPNVVENKRNLSILKTNKNVLQKIPSSPRRVTPETRRMSQSSVKLYRVSNRNIYIYTMFICLLCYAICIIKLLNIFLTLYLWGKGRESLLRGP